jgi:hypothetical protein
VILYRGTPVPERRPETRAYDCVFFASTFDTAADYAAGEKAVDEKGYGFVQKYDVGPQRLLDEDDPEARWLIVQTVGGPVTDDALILFLEPTPEWRDAVAARGYTGTRLGDDICVFDPRGITLLAGWRVEWDAPRDRWRRYKVA